MHPSAKKPLITQCIVNPAHYWWSCFFPACCSPRSVPFTYGMPLPALSLNIAWEFIFSLYVSETLLEKSVFSIWLLIDLGLVYGMLKYGREEWKDRPWVGRWLGSVFWSATAWCTMGMWAFCRWWIEERVGGGRIGKVYRGVKGEVDTTELGYCELQYCILRVWRGGF